MRYFQDGFSVTSKLDDSPVTEADIASSRHIEKHLVKVTPHFPVISEESVNKAVTSKTYWLVDPLDGTRAFVEGQPEFAICMGLISDERPVLGILHVPSTGVSYIGSTEIPAQKIHTDGRRENISTRAPAKDHWVLIKSAKHSHPKLKEFISDYPVTSSVRMSSAIKFGLMAEGKADIYPRLGKTMEWDTAAGQAIVEAAGGYMVGLDNKPFFYGKAGFLNPGFIVFGKKPLAAEAA